MPWVLTTGVYRVLREDFTVISTIWSFTWVVPVLFLQDEICTGGDIELTQEEFGGNQSSIAWTSLGEDTPLLLPRAVEGIMRAWSYFFEK